MNTNLKRLVGKLNELCRRSLEGAAGLCLSRTHYEVDVEHWILKLIEEPELDLHLILSHYQVDLAKVSRDFMNALDHFKTGNDRTPSLSPRIPKLIELAWLIGSVNFGADRIRSGHLLLGAFRDDGLRALLQQSSSELKLVKAEDLDHQFESLVATSREYVRPVSNSLSAPDSQYQSVFICYRHEDWVIAGRIYDSLSRLVGAENVFRDLETIGPGDDWTESINKYIGLCSALLVVIGRSWKYAGSRRQLQQADDFVRYEISTALRRSIKVIPLLFDGVEMPKSEYLPDDIRSLRQRQGIKISDSNFTDAMDKLALMLKTQALSEK
jgi:hypothetical protein